MHCLFIRWVVTAKNRVLPVLHNWLPGSPLVNQQFTPFPSPETAAVLT
jgi:hypothetical protein